MQNSDEKKKSSLDDWLDSEEVAESSKELEPCLDFEECEACQL